MAQDHYFKDTKTERVIATSVPSFYERDDEYERLPRAEGERLYIAQLKDELRDSLQRAGGTVYVVHRSTSRSGMSRRLTLHYIGQDGVPSQHPHLHNITYKAARVLGWRVKDDALVVNGCGMDVGFHTVESLARVLGIDLKREWV